MNLRELESAAEEVLRIGDGAAKIVREVYATNFHVDYKTPSDPVTRADREASDYISRELERSFPGIPIVSEEADPPAGYRSASAVWFVDPLDGTRDFVLRNGQFCVMIGLAVQARAALGVVVVPDTGQRVVGVVGSGAYQVDGDRRSMLTVSTKKDRATACVAVSRSRKDAATPFLKAFGTTTPATAIGSVGIKAILVASGKADLYVQPGRAGARWDICGPEAIVLAAGGRVTDTSGGEFDYRADEIDNLYGMVLSNAHLHDDALAVVAELESAQES